jgi:hypothetical protein
VMDKSSFGLMRQTAPTSGAAGERPLAGHRSPEIT